MKNLFLLITLLTVKLTFGQSNIPDFLQGTWKMENKEIYEHWDKLNSQTLKGFSYKLKNGQMEISEYLDISERDNQTIYTATVINQNNGKGIEFKLTKTDSTYILKILPTTFRKKSLIKNFLTIKFLCKLRTENKKDFHTK